MTDIAWEYLISLNKNRSESLEIKQITMKQLIEEVAPETNWGPQKVLEFCKMSVDDGDKFFAINMRSTQYQVPIAQVKAFFAEPEAKPEPEWVPPDVSPPPSVGPVAPVPASSTVSTMKEPPKEKEAVVKKKAGTRKK